MDFSEETIRRIAAAVRYVEQQAPVTGPPHVGDDRTYAGQDWWPIFKLKTALTIGGTADAYPYIWSASDSNYHADTSTSDVVKVRDTLHKFTGGPGDLVLCRFIGNSDGSTNREVISNFGGGSKLCFGLTTATVGSGDATFTVDHITAADGGTPPTTDSSATMIISNWAGWACASSPKKVMFVVVDATAESGSIGHGNFVQAGCCS